MKPIILPIFLSHLGCRQRCLFCNQKAVSPEPLSPPSVRRFIGTSLSKLPGYQDQIKQVAFYGGSFTAIPRKEQVCYLMEVQPFLGPGLIDSIRVSTRPDSLDGEILSLLKDYGVKTIEIGAQSMIDQILQQSQRGHVAENTISSVSRLKKWGFDVGIHLMMGLPGDSRELFLRSIDQVIGLKPDFVRIHPTLVLRGAGLENLWKKGEYLPLSLDETILWLKEGLLRLERASIPVARIGLQTDRTLEKHFIAGPYHPALHQMVDSAIAFDMAARLLKNHSNGREVTFICHPREVSNLRGQRNRNIMDLQAQFHLKEILIQGSEEVTRGSLVMITSKGCVSINRMKFYPDS